MTQTETPTAEAGMTTGTWLRQGATVYTLKCVDRPHGRGPTMINDNWFFVQGPDAEEVAERVRAALAASTAPRAPAAVPDELRRLSEAATPGPWAVEAEKSDGSYGSGEDTFEGYDTAVIVTEVATETRHGKPGVLFESHNSTVGSIREESDDESFRAWDEVSEANAAFIVALVNAFRAGTLAAAPAAPPADGGTDAAKAWVKSHPAAVQFLGSPMWSYSAVIDAFLAGAAISPRTLAGAAGDPVQTDALVDRFATALKAKFRASEAKYGWQNGWLKDGWEADCQRDLARHITKGDPLDVAAYAAFCWHHGWPTWAPRNHSDETTGAVAPSLEGEAAYQARFPGAPLSDCPDWAIDAWNRVALAAISARDAGEAAESDQTSAIALEAWRQLKPCPSDESDALCSFPSCNCAVQRLAYSSPRSTAVPAACGTSELVTHAMIQAGRYAANLSDGTLAGIYQAMHSASCPTAPVVSDGKTAEARDDVLFAFNRYVNNPTPFEVTWWTRHFPQFAKDIREHAVEVIDMNHRVEALGPNDLPTASSANLRNSIIDIIRFTNRVGNAGVQIYGSDEAADKIMAAIGEAR